MTTNKDLSKIRVDKILWALRIFKTRSQASSACDLEKVKIGEQLAKASRVVRPGDEIRVRYGPFERIFRIIELTGNRLPAKKVPEYCTEITPEETISQMRARAAARAAWRQPGTGRPTKKERRELDDFMDFDDW